MIRGIKYEIQGTGIHNILRPLARLSITRKLTWIHDPNQYEDCNLDTLEEFFTEESYSGEKIISLMQEPNYILFIKLAAFWGRTDIPITQINTYEDFKKSPYLLVCLVWDCDTAEIYCKESQIANDLYEAAIQEGCVNVTYITDENDTRRRLNVL